MLGLQRNSGKDKTMIVLGFVTFKVPFLIGFALYLAQNHLPR